MSLFTGYTPGTDGGLGTFSFSLTTNVSNLGGTAVTGSLPYSVFLAKSPTGVINPSPILTQPGNLCVDGGFPCLGAFTQAVNPGDLPAIGDSSNYYNYGGNIYPGKTLNVSPSTAFSVTVPPPAGAGGGAGIYYPQMSFNTGGTTQTTITSSQGFKLGPDPAG